MEKDGRPPSSQRGPRDWAARAERTSLAMLSHGEEGFLCSMVEVARACRPLSGKQRDVLARIAAKVGSPFTGDDAGEAVESARSDRQGRCVGRRARAACAGGIDGRAWRYARPAH